MPDTNDLTRMPGQSRTDTIRMPWGTAYRLGWNASKRADLNEGADADMDVYLRRFQDRTKRDEYGRELIIGSEACDGYITGWNDQAVGNDYDEERH
jgi:hypothetical protein